jgi:hypothetical protein
MIDLVKYQDTGVKISQWIWDGFQYESILAVSLVHDFPFDKTFPLAIDTVFSARGFGIYIQNR